MPRGGFSHEELIITMFAVIYIPDFYLQAAMRLEPEGWHLRPVALVDGTSLTPVLLQLTEPAQEAGVCLGMTVTQAMARSPKIVIKSRSAAQERCTNEALLDCA